MQAFPGLRVWRLWLQWAAGAGAVTVLAEEVGFGSSSHSEEADEDILLLNRKNQKIFKNIQTYFSWIEKPSRSNEPIPVQRKVMEIFLLQHFQWPSLQGGSKDGLGSRERGAEKLRADPEPEWDPGTEKWEKSLSPVPGLQAQPWNWVKMGDCSARSKSACSIIYYIKSLTNI